jgi:hypothetical protein
MLREAAAGPAGLGLIGGAGSVVYNHNGDATVRIKGTNGNVQTVHIAGRDARSAIERQYPSHEAPRLAPRHGLSGCRMSRKRLW